MAEPNYPPGSRAIKIPISRLKNSAYASARRRSDRDTIMQRSDSNEGSSSEAGTSMPSNTSRDAAFTTRRTVASPTTTPVPFSTATSSQQQRKDKHRAADVSPPQTIPAKPLQSPISYTSPLGPTMLSSSSYKSVNLNSHADPDQPPRLITYTKHSQGFTWNDELFLPSYLVGRRYRGSKNARRWGYNNNDEDEEMDEDDIPFDEEADRCPVHDIFVTDEEAAAMLP